MLIRCLLIDDEPIARDVIESYVEQVESLHLVKKCGSAIEAFSVLRSEQVDLIFLDLEMPGLGGFDFLKTLTYSPKVIITTAYREFAVEGFDCNALDYLVKPIPFERFMKAVGKMMQFTPSRVGEPHMPPDEEPFIFVKEDRKLVKVYLHEILYLESLRDYVRITATSRCITTRHTLSFFEELLCKDQFIRIHRSFIVSIPRIAAVSENKIEAAGIELSIGANYKKTVFEKLRIKPL